MKAWVLHGVGDMRWETVENPVPGEGEVLVAVKAAGLCGSDIPRVFHTGAHVHPLIIGHEFSGVVEDIGRNVEAGWLQKRVGIFPLLPCKGCTPCRAGKYEMCRNYSYLGSRCNGGFAEYVSVPAWNLVALPDNVTFTEAAMLEPMAVAVHAMRRGTEELALAKDIPIAVCGLGTIGLLLIMFLLEAGYRNVYAVGNKVSQKERVCSLGSMPDHYFDSGMPGTAACLKRKTDGVKLFFDCTGRNAAVAMGVESMGTEGRMVLVGNPCSDMVLEKDTYWKILRNQLTVNGIWNSSYTGSGGNGADDWDYVLERLSEHHIAPSILVTHRLALENLEEGLAVMHDKKENCCKVMVTEEKL